MATHTTNPKEDTPSTQPAPAMNVPYDAPKKYETFYLVLLILSSISTTIGIASLLGVVELPKYFTESPVYAFGWIGSVLAWLVSVVALVLLWMKHPLGIWVKQASYGLSILGSILAVIGATPIIKEASDQAVAESNTSGGEIDPAMVETFVAAGIYIAIGLTIVFNIIFAVLWYIAWKKQRAADLENATS